MNADQMDVLLHNEVDKVDEAFHRSLPPLPLQPLKYLPHPVKKKKPRSSSPPFLSQPISTTAPLPAPGFCCTNQEQMSARTVLKDPAVLDASHMLFIQR